MVGFMIFASGNIFAQGPYAPGVGQDGTTAIHKDSELFVSWATGIQLTRGYTDISNPVTLASFGYPGLGIHKAEGGSIEVVSFGDGGEAILTFDRPIVNGDGYDFAVFENSFDDSFLELAFVEVSSDGVNFFRFPCVSLTSETEQVGGFGKVDPTNIHNFAGKYRQGYGTPFDLEDVAHNEGLDVNNVRFVKLIDVVGCIDDAYATYDSEGHKVNDPWPTDFPTGGFDLDGVGVINAGAPYSISNFNDLALEPNSFWNGSDGSGSFTSGILNFKNTYNASYDSWNGFAYSNVSDNTTPGYDNQYSAITGGGMDATTADGGTNYAVSFTMNDWMSGTYEPVLSEVDVVDNEAYIFNGLYVTNSTYAYMNMLNGDAFSEPFGGTSGNDPDWFKLNIFGVDVDGNYTDTVEFYLADYRFDDNSLDYIVDKWCWIDLTSLGEITGLRMYLESSNCSEYGLITPGYFCIDNISVQAGDNEGIYDDEMMLTNVNVYPNPTNSKVNFEMDGFQYLEVYNALGQMVMRSSSSNAFDLSDYPNGIYIVKFVGNGQSVTKKVIKK